MSSGSGVGLFRGCFTFLGVFALSALIIGTITYIRLPEPDVVSRGTAAVVTGVSSGFFLTFALAFLWEVVRRFQELGLLRQSVTGVPPGDGQRIAAQGVLVADGPLLEAPMSGVRSAIYKYEIIARHQKSDTEVCSGYALTPCHVATAGGNVRILAYADLAFRPGALQGPEMRARLKSYLASATVTPMGLGAAKEFLATLADDDGTIRSDTGSVLDDLDDPRLSFREYAVADGENVCAIGTYSAERGGLVPDPASVDPYPVRLRRGDSLEVRRALLVSAAGYVAGTVAMVGLAVGALVLTNLMFTS